MEKTGRAVVIEAAFDWSDLGTWGSVWEAADKDEAAECRRGRRELVSAARQLCEHATGRLIGIVGVEDIVVVASDDAVLVAPRGRSPMR